MHDDQRTGSHPRGRGDEGATLVEFAILAPLLFLIIFAIIEFGWAFGQHLDVRHGAREASRLAAVNYGVDAGYVGAVQTNQIGQAACDRMDLDGVTTIQITLDDTDGSGAVEVGEYVEITVTHPLNTITGFLDFAFPDPTNLTSTVRTRIERGVENEVTYVDGTYTCL